MARLNFILTTTTEVTTGSGATKTLLQLNAPANQRVAVKSVEVTFKGTDPSATPILVQLIQQTASTGAGSTTANVAKEDPGIGTAVQSSGKQTFTSEPTVGAVVRQWEVHPQAGLLYSFALGDEAVCPSGGALGLAVNAAAAVNCTPQLRCEE